MNERNLASTLVARHELEDCWRRKLEDAQERYRVAAKRYQRSREESHGLPTENSALVLARDEQSETRMDLLRILRIFTELTVHGRIPEAGSTEKTNGVAQ